MLNKSKKLQLEKDNYGNIYFVHTDTQILKKSFYEDMGINKIVFLHTL